MTEETPTVKLPGYAKFTLVLLAICLLVTIVSLGRTIIMPIAFSLLFAILLRPVVVFFNKKLRFPHVLAVLITVILFCAFIAGLLFFVGWQFSYVMSDWEALKKNFGIHYEHLRHWVREQFSLSYSKQAQYLEDVKNNSLKNNQQLIGQSLISVTGALANIILVPIYTFLILLYRNLFLKFLHMLIRDPKHDETLANIMLSIKVVIQSYIVGLLIEMAIIVTLTTGGFMIIGLKYALLLGLLTALLNLIPYVGLLIAGIIAVLTALVTSTETSIVLGSIIVNVVVQLIDNNFLVPKIVGNKVQINAFVSMTGVIVGGTIAGIPGMFLSLPVIAILKVVFDNIPELKPWGFALGDDLPKTTTWYRVKFTSFDAGDDAVHLNIPFKETEPIVNPNADDEAKENMDPKTEK